jgi:hypothetical protein
MTHKADPTTGEPELLLNVSGSITGTPDHPLLPGTVVIVQDKNDPSNQCTASVTIAADGTGTWNCDLPKILPEGVNTVTAQAKDTAGRLSNTVESTFKVDTIPPFIIPDTSDPAHIGITTEPNAEVEIQNDQGKTICTTQADDQGNAICSPAPGDVPKPGDLIHITATDEAGNVGKLDTNIISVTVSKPTLTIPNDLQQVITGHYFQPGENVHGVIDGTIDLGYKTADANGEVQFTYNAPNDTAFLGTHTVVLRGDKSGPGKATFAVAAFVAPPIPTTGATISATFAGGGAAALALGTGLILLAWRRRREHEEAILQQI